MSPSSNDDDRYRVPAADRGGAGRVAFNRVGALMTSVMDLHVRIALQEADREKLVMMLLALIGAQLALGLWLHQGLGWSWIHSALAMAGLNLVLAGVFLRVGGQLTKGPYLPQTTAGITKTTKALLGR